MSSAGSSSYGTNSNNDRVGGFYDEALERSVSCETAANSDVDDMGSREIAEKNPGILDPLGPL